MTGTYRRSDPGLQRSSRRRGLTAPALALCGATLLLLPPQAFAAPDAVGAAGNDPSLDETFQRGQALAVDPGLGFVIFPIPISNPAIGTGLGLAAGVLYQMDEASQPSYTGVGGLATSSHSWGVGALQYFSLDGDRYRLSLGLGYATVNYDFYGAGADAGDRGASIPISQEGYFTNPFFEVRVAEDLYLGLQYRLIEARTGLDAGDRDDPIGRLLDGRQADFISSGLGPLLDWDTRDDPFWPRSGHLLHASAVFAGGSFLSDFDYQKGLLGFSSYHEVFEDGVLAARAAGCFAQGDVPVVDLCLFGANNDLRGYETGRYRDERSLALQLEQRWMFAERWGLVGFAGVGGVGSDIGDVLDSEVLASGGLGLRFQASKDYRVNVAVDSAVNLDGDVSVYFRIGEAF